MGNSTINHAKEDKDEGFFADLTAWKLFVLFGVLMMVLWPIAMVANII